MFTNKTSCTCIILLSVSVCNFVNSPVSTYARIVCDLIEVNLRFRLLLEILSPIISPDSGGSCYALLEMRKYWGSGH